MAVKNRKYATRSPKRKKITIYHHIPTRTSPTNKQTNITFKNEEEVMMLMVKQITFQL
jgi:hypothetical protein